MGSPRILAIDIGSGHVACGVFMPLAGGQFLLERIACESHDAAPSPDDSWNAGVARSLAAIARRPWARRSCRVAIPGRLASTKFLRAPVPGNTLREAAAAAAAENIPYSLDDVVWDFAVQPDGGFGSEMMLASVKREAIGFLCDAAESAGLSVRVAVPSGISLFHAFRHSHPEVSESVIVADIGARSTQLLFAGGGRFRLRSLPLAGNSLTEFIAAELGMDFGSAERLKLQIPAGPPESLEVSREHRALQRARDDFVARLQLEITRSIIHCRRQIGATAPCALYLAGGGSLMSELPERLGSALRLQVERLQVLRNLEVSAEARAAGAANAAHALVNLVGLAAGAAVAGPSSVNLMPPERVKALRLRKRLVAACATAAGVAGLLLPPITYFRDATSRTGKSLAPVEEQLMQLHAMERRHSGNLQMLAQLEQRVAALQSARDSRGNWIEFLAGVQECLLGIGDVWIDRLEIVRPTPRETAADPPARAPWPGGLAPAPRTREPGEWAESPRILIHGRLLDVANPLSRVSSESTVRVKRLLESFKGLPFVSAVENERFDNAQHGLLRFDVTLTLNSEKTL